MTERWWQVISDNNVYFEKILGLIKKTVDSHNKEYKKLEEKYKKEDPPVREDGYTWQDHLGEVAYEHWQTEQILYKSFVISIFMFMEGKLLELCKHLEKEYNQNLSVNDLSGTGATRSVNYIKKVVGIDFPTNPKVSQQFYIANEVRHQLVHADGKIPDSEKQEQFKKKVVAHCKGKIDIRNNEIEFGEKYLRDLISLNEKICDEISHNWTGEGDDWLRGK